jgi:protein TonB
MVHSNEPFPEIATNKEIANPVKGISDSQETNSSNQNSGSTSNAEYVEPTDYGNSIIKATSLDKLPEFPGGIKQLNTFVGNNFEKSVIDDNETIRVFVNFII